MTPVTASESTLSYIIGIVLPAFVGLPLILLACVTSIIIYHRSHVSNAVHSVHNETVHTSNTSKIVHTTNSEIIHDEDEQEEEESPKYPNLRFELQKASLSAKNSVATNVFQSSVSEIIAEPSDLGLISLA